MHTGYLPTASVKYPTLGSIVAQEIGDPAQRAAELRAHRRRARFGDGGAGFLGVDYDPFVMQAAGRPPENTSLATDRATATSAGSACSASWKPTTPASGGKQEVGRPSEGLRPGRQDDPQPARWRPSTSPRSRRRSATPTAVGRSARAACWPAGWSRRASRSSRSTLGNWDTHQDNFDRSKHAVPASSISRSRPCSADLEAARACSTARWSSGWANSAARRGSIPTAGRDHYPRAFNAALAGGGVKGGQVIGKTDAGGDSGHRPARRA